jgi:hypothetical protein
MRSAADSFQFSPISHAIATRSNPVDASEEKKFRRGMG